MAAEITGRGYSIIILTYFNENVRTNVTLERFIYANNLKPGLDM